MAKQIEKAGIPTVIITALPEVAKNVGVSRIIKAAAITHPTGDPEKSSEREKTERIDISKKALKALTTAVPIGEHISL
jgi:glycine/betaine/sarcosine/D-proline reductase family selenoprotein B